MESRDRIGGAIERYGGDVGGTGTVAPARTIHTEAFFSFFLCALAAMCLVSCQLRLNESQQNHNKLEIKRDVSASAPTALEL